MLTTWKRRIKFWRKNINVHSICLQPFNAFSLFLVSCGFFLFLLPFRETIVEHTKYKIHTMWLHIPLCGASEHSMQFAAINHFSFSFYFARMTSTKQRKNYLLEKEKKRTVRNVKNRKKTNWNQPSLFREKVKQRCTSYNDVVKIIVKVISTVVRFILCFSIFHCLLRTEEKLSYSFL